MIEICPKCGKLGKREEQSFTVRWIHESTIPHRIPDMCYLYAFSDTNLYKYHYALEDTIGNLYLWFSSDNFNLILAEFRKNKKGYIISDGIKLASHKIV